MVARLQACANASRISRRRASSGGRSRAAPAGGRLRGGDAGGRCRGGAGRRRHGRRGVRGGRRAGTCRRARAAAPPRRARPRLPARGRPAPTSAYSMTPVQSRPSRLRSTTSAGSGIICMISCADVVPSTRESTKPSVGESVSFWKRSSGSLERPEDAVEVAERVADHVGVLRRPAPPRGSARRSTSFSVSSPPARRRLLLELVAALVPGEHLREHLVDVEGDGVLEAARVDEAQLDEAPGRAASCRASTISVARSRSAGESRPRRTSISPSCSSATFVSALTMCRGGSARSAARRRSRSGGARLRRPT